MDHSSDIVEIKLDEIQRIRDVLARLPERHTSHHVRLLCEQVAGLYQRLSKQLITSTPTTPKS